eukprot:c25369_g1_i1 orf=1513-3207(+)
MEDLQYSTNRALTCAYVCSSNLNQAYPSRFLKAVKVEEVISSLEKELDGETLNNLSIGVSTILKGMQKKQDEISFTSIGDEGIVGQVEERQAAVDYLKMDCDKVAVCLHGMGGIGKSTQAFSIFKKFQAMDQRYRYCRAVLDLETKSADLPKFQRQILQKICKGEIRRFSDVEEGKALMQRELPKCGLVFLYLDNVMDPNHLPELLPHSSCFAHGSKLLITTRNKNVFHKLKDLGFAHCKCIEVQKLKEGEAQALLFKDIWSLPSGKSTDIEKLKGKVLKLCGGLPLALKVVRGYIAKYRDMEVEHLRDVVEKMSEAIPLCGEGKDDMYSIIKFSIDQLHSEFKKAFLDLVVYRNGQSWKCAERLVGKVILESLLEYSLIVRVPKLDWMRRSQDIVEVHDVLYAIGKQMAHNDPSEIRIIGEEDFHNLKNRGSLKTLVGLSNITIKQADLLQQIPCVRVLDGVEIEVECERSTLQHLKLVRISRSIVPIPIHFSACTGLKEVVWENVQGQLDLEVFKGLPNLEALILTGRGSEIQGVQVLESLTSLKELMLESFTSFQSLPEGI